MLLIEGPDMVGKTTLAHAIVAELAKRGKPASYMKFGMESRGKMSYEYLKNRINPWTVCDRMHWSESIYAIATGEVPSLSGTAMAAVERRMDQIAGMLVVLIGGIPDYAQFTKGIHTRGEDFNIETCVTVNSMYREVCDTGKLACSSGLISIEKPDITFEVKYNRHGNVEFVPGGFVSAVVSRYIEKQSELG